MRPEINFEARDQFWGRKSIFRPEIKFRAKDQFLAQIPWLSEGRVVPDPTNRLILCPIIAILVVTLLMLIYFYCLLQFLLVHRKHPAKSYSYFRLSFIFMKLWFWHRINFDFKKIHDFSSFLFLLFFHFRTVIWWIFSWIITVTQWLGCEIVVIFLILRASRGDCPCYPHGDHRHFLHIIFNWLTVSDRCFFSHIILKVGLKGRPVLQSWK